MWRITDSWANAACAFSPAAIRSAARRRAASSSSGNRRVTCSKLSLSSTFAFIDSSNLPAVHKKTPPPGSGAGSRCLVLAHAEPRPPKEEKRDRKRAVGARRVLPSCQPHLCHLRFCHGSQLHGQPPFG